MTGGRSRIAEHRRCARAINVLVTPARNQKSGAGGDNNITGKERPEFETAAVIETKVITRVIGEKNQLGRSGVDGPDIIDVNEAFQFRCDVCIKAVAENRERRD